MLLLEEKKEEEESVLERASLPLCGEEEEVLKLEEEREGRK